MPEFNKGFIPFAYVDENRIYDDEVGNDYDPKGWNTASAMTNKTCTVTANDGKDKFTVVHAKVDERVNWDGFKEGIWNKTKCDCEGGGGTYIAPSIKNFEVSIDDVVNVDDGPIKDFSASVEFNKGSDVLNSVTFEISSEDVIIISQKVEKPDSENLKFEVDDSTMEKLVESGATEIKVKIILSNDEEDVVEEKVIYLVHSVLFGVVYTNENDVAAGIIKNLTEPERIQKRTIAYNKEKFILRSFYPTDDWAYMFIAVPQNFGRIKNIFNGAAYEIGPNEWNPSSCEINGIKYNLYLLQYNNEGTYEFVVAMV